MIKHKHHIIPKHAGGTDDESNLVELTIKEHADAHKKLYDEYGRPEDKLAWQCLAGMLSKEEIIREVCSLAGKKGGAKGGKAGKGKKQTPEWIEKRKMIGEKNPMYGRIWSEEENKSRKDFMKNEVKKTEGEWRGTTNLLNSTKRRTELGLMPSQAKWICHCGKTGKGLSNYNRWHGKNCKIVAWKQQQRK